MSEAFIECHKRPHPTICNHVPRCGRELNKEPLNDFISKNELVITLEGQPVPLMRPRTFVKGGRTTTWNPSRDKMLQARAELRIQLKIRGVSTPLPELPITSPCQLHVSFRMKAARKKDLGKAHSIRPDIDNLIKFLLDVGNGVVWFDDSQINTIIANKIMHENPHTFFRLVW